MPTTRPRRAALVSLLTVAAATAAAALPAAAQAEKPFRVVAVNACDLARRCGGNPTQELKALIRDRDTPNVVAINEVCSETVADVAKAKGYHRVFTQAGTKRCGRRGRYGNALLLSGGDRPTAAQISRTRYAVQGNEVRTLTCVSRGREVCVTHLAHDRARGARHKRQLAARLQAKQLERLLEQRAGGPQTILAGDLNLEGANGGRAQPAGWWRVDDTRRMHVIGESGTPSAPTVTSVPWTDHPILQVDVTG